MKPVCIIKRINEFMIIIINVFSVLILCKYSVTNKSLFFYGKIRNLKIYKVINSVCIFKIINEFMIMIIDVFSVLLLCKYSVTNKFLIFFMRKLEIQ